MRSLFTAVLVLCATTLAAQTTEPGKLGLNVSFSGEGAGIGTSWRVSPNVTLRPGVVFTWVKTTSPFGGGNESTIWGLGLDVLFRGASWDRVSTYVGVGGSYSHANGNAAVGTYQWDARALFGARIRVVDRVWVYGEAGMQYLRSDGFFDAQFSLATFPLGVTIYLK